MKLTKEQIQSVKARGFLLNRGTENFSGRIVPVAGVYSAEDLASISECAKKFGNGKVCFTSRLAAEIVGIPFEKIDEADAFARSRGLYFGGTGAKVRPLTSCKGTTCVYGNIDTQKLGAVLHEKFYAGMADVKLPHKFKIGVGGCPNSCMKPSLNDVGIEGLCEFEFDSEHCRGCAKCAVEMCCPSRAVSRNENVLTAAYVSANVRSEQCRKAENPYVRFMSAVHGENTAERGQDFRVHSARKKYRSLWKR